MTLGFSWGKLSPIVNRTGTLMTQDQLIAEHRAAFERFKAAPDGTPEHAAADAALAASFARLSDRLADEGEECAFFRRQAS